MNMITDNPKNNRILIVDDVPQNIQVLANILQEAGYQLGFARDGKSALAHIDSTRFDLVLLDIMMPEIDGYEVCARLKKDKKKKDIPVIFITARESIEDKTRGFALGAVDYITKPFDTHEVLARVKTHLTIHNYATALERMVEERTRQLIHADRLATLGTFSAAIVHEVNNPVSYVMANTKILEEFWSLAKPILAQHGGEDKTGQLSRDVEDVDEWLRCILDGSSRISRLVKSLRTYARRIDARRQKHALIDIVHDAINLLGHKLKYCGLTVEIDIPPELMIYCDQQKISQVFVNLISNACDACEVIKNRDGKITIKAEAIEAAATEERATAAEATAAELAEASAIPANRQVNIWIKDNGPGIPQEISDQIFDPFFTTKDEDKGTGLGLFIVQTVIEEHYGSISLSSNTAGQGAEFRITLPFAPKCDEPL